MRLKLAVFDLDGTLKVERDPYVYLHKQLGTWERSQEFFGDGLAGLIPYEEWLRLDASLWKDVPRTHIEELFRRDQYLPGAQETVRKLRAWGVYVAIISTGLLLHAQQVQADLGVDYVVANEILFEDGRVSGEVRAHIPEGGKGVVLDALLARTGISATECLAVGDGDSDVDLFQQAGVSVAVAPRSELVRAAADIVLPEQDLSSLLERVWAFAPWLLES